MSDTLGRRKVVRRPIPRMVQIDELVDKFHKIQNELVRCLVANQEYDWMAGFFDAPFDLARNYYADSGYSIRNLASHLDLTYHQVRGWLHATGVLPKTTVATDKTA